MQLRLVSNKVSALHITQRTGNDNDNNKINFRYDSRASGEKSQGFILTFDFSLMSERGFELKLEHDFVFETDSPITDEFWAGTFHTINAPAIAYPYLRAFVSTILLNAGLEAVLLPSINFVEMSKQQKKELNSH